MSILLSKTKYKLTWSISLGIYSLFASVFSECLITKCRTIIDKIKSMPTEKKQGVVYVDIVTYFHNAYQATIAATILSSDFNSL